VLSAVRRAARHGLGALSRLLAVRGRRVLATGVALALGAAAVVALADGRPGVAPVDPWSCPPAHPIKGYVSAETGRRVYYLPGGRFYEEASPERCYGDEAEAARDGSRPARSPAPRWLAPEVVRLRP
jgi:hypothetical protein